ncbi:MAG: undecaprenyl-diphosphate phosphatase, partial [Alphaproteobacteria bacterium]
MPFAHLILLALVQGVTEFLPISSSAHLVLVPLLTGWRDQGVLIDVAMHVGTLAAVLIYFHRDTRGLFLALLASLGVRPAGRRLGDQQTAYRRLFWALVLATIPVVMVGLAFKLTGLIDMLRRVEVIATTSIVFGLVLWWADRRGATARGFDDIKLKAALLIGLAQVLALIPGTSRSGITMTAARALGFNRPSAARFSMLLAIPTILAAGGLEMLELLQLGTDAPWSDALLAAGLSFLFALAAIGGLMRWLRHADFTIFVVYRVLLGAGLF